MNKTCFYCETAEATGLKVEAALEFTGEGEATKLRRYLICDACQVEWFDGTEEYPEVIAL